MALGCREQAGRGAPWRSGPECYSISPDPVLTQRAQSQSSSQPLSFAVIQDPLLPPHPFQPPSLVPRVPEACDSAGKVKVPEGCNSNSLSGAACGEDILVHLGPLARAVLPSLILSLVVRYLSFQTTGCPSSQNTSASRYQDVPPPHTHTHNYPRPTISALDRQEGSPPFQMEPDRCAPTLYYPL